MKKHLLLLIAALMMTFAGFAQSTDLAMAGNANVMATTVNFYDAFPGDDQVIFYPNPVKSLLNIKFPEKGNFTVQIYNIVGEKIIEESIVDDDLIKINMSNYNNGMYFLTYRLNNKVITKTFTKNQ